MQARVAAAAGAAEMLLMQSTVDAIPKSSGDISKIIKTIEGFPFRPTSSHVMRRSRPPGRVRRQLGLRSWPTEYVLWPIVWRRRRVKRRE